MREIKFRAWDNKENEILYDVQNTYDYGCRGDNKVMENSFSDLLNDNNYQVMQYTGLKDKNGKEIYEGDILEDEEVRIKVLYESDGFYGQIIKLKKMCGTEVGLKYHLSFFQDDGNDLEVIGNIYDNPELLGE